MMSQKLLPFVTALGLSVACSSDTETPASADAVSATGTAPALAPAPAPVVPAAGGSTVGPASPDITSGGTTSPGGSGVVPGTGGDSSSAGGDSSSAGGDSSSAGGDSSSTGGVSSGTGGAGAGGQAQGGAANGGASEEPVAPGGCNLDGVTATYNDEDPTRYQETSFENGEIDPFIICTTRSPNYGRATEFMGRNVLEFSWSSDPYLNGQADRTNRGAEACTGPRFHKEGWYGFQFYLPTPGFPMDKHQGIAQIFSLGGCNSWASKLDIDGNTLRFTRRGHCGTPPDDNVVIAEDVERNTWIPVIIHFVISNDGNGLTEVWYGDDVCNRDQPTYRAEGINYGFGEWDTDTDSLTRYPIDPNSQGGFREFETNEIELKIGMYNFDSNDYDPGETRTIYYDNVSMIAEEGEDGWRIVNPAFDN